jgi:hypothetical protein
MPANASSNRQNEAKDAYNERGYTLF